MTITWERVAGTGLLVVGIPLLAFTVYGPWTMMRSMRERERLAETVLATVESDSLDRVSFRICNNGYQPIGSVSLRVSFRWLEAASAPGSSAAIGDGAVVMPITVDSVLAQSQCLVAETSGLSRSAIDSVAIDVVSASPVTTTGK
jgi:hypothetical protein